MPRKEELVSNDLAIMELAPLPTGAPPLMPQGHPHAA